MSSDQEINSSCGSSDSSGEFNRRKSSKKNKRKSEKNSKREMRHKRAKKRRSYDTFIGCSGQGAAPSAASENTVPEDMFGPALPPHLLKSQSSPTILPEKTPLIGPIMPSNFLLAQTDTITNTPYTAITTTTTLSDTKTAVDDKVISDDDGETIGPLPTLDDTSKPLSAKQIALEERALALKIAAIDGGISKSTTEQESREEWMTELPDVGLKTGLAALSNMKRTFYQGKERPDFSDRSSWTKTPQNANSGVEKPSTSRSKTEDLEKAAIRKYERERDEEQERNAKKHKKKHKRDVSLVELHQKKLRKEQRKKEKELTASGAKQERRPFSREVDLKLNKIDSNQTKQIVDKAKILNSKFASGHTKYL